MIVGRKAKGLCRDAKYCVSTFCPKGSLAAESVWEINIFAVRLFCLLFGKPPPKPPPCLRATHRQASRGEEYKGTMSIPRP